MYTKGRTFRKINFIYEKITVSRRKGNDVQND